MNRDAVRNFANRGAAVIASLWGECVTIGGVKMEATVSDPEGRLIQISGGTNVSGDVIVSVLKTLLPTAPPADTTEVLIGTTAYIVRSLQGEKEISPSWRLVCEPKN